MAARTEERSPLAAFLRRLFGPLVVLAIAGWLLLFLILPIGVILIKAFHGHVDGAEGWTFAYFKLLADSPLEVSAFGHSLLIGVGTTILGTILALPLALAQQRFVFRGKGILSALLLAPMVMPPFVGAIGIQRLFARRGAVTLLLMKLGLITEPVEWLADQNKLWAVILLEVLHLYPIIYLNLTAALANIDPSLDEMAKSLGASPWRRFKDIAWPLARPGYFAGAIIVFIWALTDLGTPLLVGFHDALPVRIFNMVSDVNENPVGHALVVVVILLSSGLFLAGKGLAGGGNKKHEMMLTRGGVKSSARPLSGVAAIPVYTLYGLTILLAVVPHLAVLLTSVSESWFMTILPERYGFGAYHDVFATDLPLLGIRNSLFLSSLSTVVDVLLGTAVAYVVARRLIPFGGLLDALVMVPLALPGIVLAFGYVVTFSDTPLDPMRNPFPLLIMAYAIRRLPYLVRAAAAGLAQLSPTLEEASLLCGASRLRTLLRITLPLVTANLVAGALMCFAYAMLDVSDGLILAMQDRFYPLTKAIYVLFLEQGRGEIVASALGVIGMGILGAAILGASLLLGKKMGEIFKAA